MLFINSGRYHIKATTHMLMVSKKFYLGVVYKMQSWCRRKRNKSLSFNFLSNLNAPYVVGRKKFTFLHYPLSACGIALLVQLMVRTWIIPNRLSIDWSEKGAPGYSATHSLLFCVPPCQTGDSFQPSYLMEEHLKYGAHRYSWSASHRRLWISKSFCVSITAAVLNSLQETVIIRVYNKCVLPFLFCWYVFSFVPYWLLFLQFLCDHNIPLSPDVLHWKRLRLKPIKISLIVLLLTILLPIHCWLLLLAPFVCPFLCLISTLPTGWDDEGFQNGVRYFVVDSFIV